MPAKHLDRLNPVDASFLAQEVSGSHMHIGGLMVFEGPPPRWEQLVEHVGARLHLVPRYRQKLAFPRFEMGLPLWIDDPHFNIEYHVRHTALPPPGDVGQLRQLTARIFSQRLDRSKPLWEMWLVQGLDNDRFAVIAKNHHCLVDGISGVDLTAVLLDLQREGAELEPPVDHWTPSPEPSAASVAARGAVGAVRAPFELAAGAAGALSSPRRALARAREVAEGVGEIAWGIVGGTDDDTPLNVPISEHRRVHWETTSLDGLKEVKNALGGTVNDVFLAVVSGALTRWLRTRGVRTEGLDIRGCVPVSIRSDDQQGVLGNQITMMMCPLPVYAEDPVERLRIVSEAMSDLKESKQALGAEAIAGLQEFAPPTVFARASRLNFSSRVYNLLVTNVPGPQFPLYLLGRELEQLVPVPFLAAEKALAVAIMSYNGAVTIGLIGDYDGFDDLEDFGGFVVESIAELEEAARGAAVAPTG